MTLQRLCVCGRERASHTQLQLLGGGGQQADHIGGLLGAQTLVLGFLEPIEELCRLVQLVLETLGFCDAHKHRGGSHLHFPKLIVTYIIGSQTQHLFHKGTFNQTPQIGRASCRERV